MRNTAVTADQFQTDTYTREGFAKMSTAQLAFATKLKKEAKKHRGLLPLFHEFLEKVQQRERTESDVCGPRSVCDNSNHQERLSRFITHTRVFVRQQFYSFYDDDAEIIHQFKISDAPLKNMVSQNDFYTAHDVRIGIDVLNFTHSSLKKGQLLCCIENQKLTIYGFSQYFSKCKGTLLLISIPRLLELIPDWNRTNSKDQLGDFLQKTAFNYRTFGPSMTVEGDFLIDGSEIVFSARLSRYTLDALRSSDKVAAAIIIKE